MVLTPFFQKINRHKVKENRQPLRFTPVADSKLSASVCLLCSDYFTITLTAFSASFTI